MRICKLCGRQSENNTFYCPECGHEMSKIISDEEQAKFDNHPNTGEDVDRDELARMITNATIGQKSILFKRTK